MTQCEQIADYIKKGKRISPLEALNFFGCFRLAARIADLRRRGLDIRSEMVDETKDNGETKRHAVYWLAKDGENNV